MTITLRQTCTHESGLWTNFARFLLNRQTSLCSSVLLFILLSHNLVSDAETVTIKFLQLSYYNPLTNKYGVGADDLYFIVFYVILITAARAFTISHLLVPLAQLQGILKQKKLNRFTEQAWLLTYYSVFWPMGMYIYYHSSYFLNLERLWTDWPDRELSGLAKYYFLVQLSFWLQQIAVLHIEEKRKDYWMVLTHHFVTIGLIWSCYCYHLTNVGNLILIIMDVADILLPLAKCLRYSGFKKSCDAVFGLFVLSWVISRHALYLRVCWSIYADIPKVMQMGCFRGTNDDLIGPMNPPPGLSYLISPFTDPSGLVCFTDTIKWAFLVPLLVLQGLTAIWLAMIGRIIWGILHGGTAEDTRSEGENSGEDEASLKGISKPEGNARCTSYHARDEPPSNNGWYCSARLTRQIEHSGHEKRFS
ncbi:hypothetical protein ACJ41O_003590 [Fusarium nematophilum]